ncbi:MAG: halocarboxylic acid dehydrogenase DehI family protein [Pseudomonadota bacterium]
MPAIRPVPEPRADPALRALYDETKRVFQVPWMGVVTMAFAAYPRFWQALWRGLAPLAETRAFVEACADLRAAAEAEAEALGPAPLSPELARLGYAPAEVAEIRGLIEVFSHGNMPYVLTATLARLRLEGEAASAEAPAARFEGRHGPAAPGAGLILMEPHHADPATREVYARVRSRLGLPFVNTDYRAYARWPSAFAAAWSGLEAHLDDPAHGEAVDRLHHRAVALSRALPDPGGLAPEALEAAAAQDASVEEVRAVVRLFQWLLPGLILNVAVFRAQLMEDANG